MENDAVKMREWSQRLADAMGKKLRILIDQDNCRLVLQLTKLAGPVHTKTFASMIAKKIAPLGLSSVAGNTHLFNKLSEEIVRVSVEGENLSKDDVASSYSRLSVKSNTNASQLKALDSSVQQSSIVVSSSDSLNLSKSIVLSNGSNEEIAMKNNSRQMALQKLNPPPINEKSVLRAAGTANVERSNLIEAKKENAAALINNDASDLELKNEKNNPLAIFMRKYEISRQFAPFGGLKLEDALIPKLQSCKVRNVCPIIMEYFSVSLTSASSRVWAYFEHPEKQPHNEISFKCLIQPRNPFSRFPVEQEFDIHLYPPVVDSSCRIRSNFGSDRFLRVEFDKDFIKDNPEKIPRRFVLCDRVYEFLIPRDSYCYYFATKSLCEEFEEIPTFDVINWQVPISKNQNMTVHKFSSRISLGFSNIIGRISAPRYKRIPDVISPSGNIMTDGCAPVGLGIMEKVRDALNLPKGKIPSAVQARFGSAKGIWYLDVTVDPETIYVRDSQVKFVSSAEPTELEILGYSKPSGPSRLNRQLVSVLESCGVPVHIFVKLQAEMVDRIRRRIFAEDPFVGACYVEKITKEMDDPNNENNLLGRIFSMILSGFDKTNPFLKSLLNALFARNIQGIKERAKIELVKSRSVLIVADPTNTLKPGQCFLQLLRNDDEDDKIGIFTGKVAAARNPCYLYSDFQLLECIDVPELRHFEEVLVLSVQGDRAAAEIFGGGDYDGDKLFITWDPRIIANMNPKPAPDVISAKLDSKFEKQEIPIMQLLDAKGHDGLMTFLFDQFVESKRLLRIFSFWHMKLADQFGLFDKRVIELGCACVKLVDAAKSGVRPQKEYVHKLEAYMQNFQVPHWYPKKAKNTRNSTSAIAQMFDALDGDAIDPQEDYSRNAWDQDLLSVLKTTDPTTKGRIESRVNALFADYIAEVSLRYDQDKDGDVSDIGKRFRRKLFAGCANFSEKAVPAVIAYKITTEKSMKIKRQMDFCWNVCGDILEALKACSIQDRQNAIDGCDTSPQFIPKHFVRRLSIDQRTLIYD